MTTSDARKRLAEQRHKDATPTANGPQTANRVVARERLDPDAIAAIRERERSAQGIALDETVARWYRTDVPLLLAALDEAQAEAERHKDVLFERGEKWKNRTEIAEAASRSHFEARNMLAKKVDRLEAQLVEVRRTRRALPCDGLCSEYPEEDCSLHGREPAELWEAIAEKNKHAEHERARADAAERQSAAQAEVIERIESFAKVQAARVRGTDQGRAWLDVLTVIERAAAPTPPAEAEGVEER